MENQEYTTDIPYLKPNRKLGCYRILIPTLERGQDNIHVPFKGVLNEEQRVEVFKKIRMALKYEWEFLAEKIFANPGILRYVPKTLEPKDCGTRYTFPTTRLGGKPTSCLSTCYKQVRTKEEAYHLQMCKMMADRQDVLDIMLYRGDIEPELVRKHSDLIDKDTLFYLEQFELI